VCIFYHDVGILLPIEVADLSSSLTCREVVIHFFEQRISSFTLNGILSQLGDLGDTPVSALTPQSALWFRRRVERVCRSYLTLPEQTNIVLQNLDALFAAASIQLPDITLSPATASGSFAAVSAVDPKTQKMGSTLHHTPPSPPVGISTIPEMVAMDSIKSPPPSKPTTSITPVPATPRAVTAAKPPVIFSFTTEEEFHLLQVELHKTLTSYLRDSSVVRRLYSGIERAARAALVNGDAEISLELDAGLRGRLVFSVRSSNGQTCLSGAVFAAY
jgi:hypothetical protein